jgi:hypothetical protein
LPFERTRVIDVVTVITKGEKNMTTITEQTETAPAEAAAEPKATKKANMGARGAHVAPKKGKSGKKATPAKKGARAKETAKGAKTKSKPASRDGNKTQQILELLKRPGGATAQELMKATGWQAHSVRGFLSGTIGKKLGLAVISTKGEDGERSYSVKV